MVSTVELFFDLVFVFIITQLTGSLAAHLDAVALLHVLVLLGVTWWMYGGYAWLTNHVAPSNTARRTLLLVGMAGFLVMGLAIPDVSGDAGWAFGVGYFVVNAVHTGLFAIGGGGSRLAMRRLAPLNLVSAGLVLAGGFAPTHVRFGLWTAALALQIASPYLHRIGSFSIEPAHFAERHGLLIIIALGESIVAIGVGAAGHRVDLGVIVVAVAGLIIAYYLYWTYFGGDDTRAEHALAAVADPWRRARLSISAYGYLHYPMLVAVILTATGVKKATGHAFEPISRPASLAVAGGAALFLLAHAWFRRQLGIGGIGYRVLAAAACLATVPLGLWRTAAQLGGMALALSVPLSIEGYLRLRADRSATGDPHSVPSENAV